MFETGDYVVYGHVGICQVKGVTTMNMDGIPKDRLYYVLQPDGKTEGTVYTPVDNMKLVLRPVMTKEEAEQLIEEIPEIDTLFIENDKLRETTYKECLKSCNSRELVRIIKTIYFRRRDRLASGKKSHGHGRKIHENGRGQSVFGAGASAQDPEREYGGLHYRKDRGSIKSPEQNPGAGGNHQPRFLFPEGTEGTNA